ncbi:hypothetical protein EJ02DRAFT_465271 [Clathrospora elynae]|uniref:Uncharacterized protein n=1 Tax=Clathrospora elynae TaxID=706981 RepID=A0A6A5SQV1_9PLEO|nr:hypothetical protein EJ02DRAFT_465271 [Clathrospora elynae]
MANIWTDTRADADALQTASTPSQPVPRSALTSRQKLLLRLYKHHDENVADLMNTVVNLGISIARERDEPSVQYLKDELVTAQEELVVERNKRRVKEREIRDEVKKLEVKDAPEARAQGRELGGVVQREKSMGMGLRMMR